LKLEEGSSGRKAGPDKKLVDAAGRKEAKQMSELDATPYLKCNAPP